MLESQLQRMTCHNPAPLSDRSRFESAFASFKALLKDVAGRPVKNLCNAVDQFVDLIASMKKWKSLGRLRLR